MPRKKTNIFSLTVKNTLFYLIENGDVHEIVVAADEHWTSKLTELKPPILLFSYRNGYEQIPFKDYRFISIHSKAYDYKMKFEINQIRYGQPNEVDYVSSACEKQYIIELGRRVD